MAFAMIFHEGYWGPHVGFYGGIDYGFGYTGAGYAGGYWNNGAFYYNRSCKPCRQRERTSTTKRW